MSKPFRPNKFNENKCMAVFSGDRSCLRSVVRYWAGLRGTELLDSKLQSFRLWTDDHTAEITIIIEHQHVLSKWPGGRLVWLFPERGPSEPELAQMRQFLSSHQKLIPSIDVLLCIPSGITHADVERDLDIISETLSSSIDFESSLEAVWLEKDGVDSLGSWLRKIRG